MAIIMVEQERIEAMMEPAEATVNANAQSEDNKPIMKPVCKGKGKKNVEATENEGK